MADPRAGCLLSAALGEGGHHTAPAPAFARRLPWGLGGEALAGCANFSQALVWFGCPHSPLEPRAFKLIPRGAKSLLCVPHHSHTQFLMVPLSIFQYSHDTKAITFQ
jgi:hypothetical protein